MSSVTPASAAEKLKLMCADLPFLRTSSAPLGRHFAEEAHEECSEAMQPGTTPQRREALRSQLLAYCRLDTLATVKLWEVFSGRRNLA